MAPRKMQQGASATTRRTTGTRGSGASSSRRTGTSASRTTATSSRAKSSATKSSANKKTASRATSTSRASSSRAASTRKRGTSAKRQQPRQWWFVPALIAATVLLFGWAYYPAARVQYRETRERARLAYELKSLQARNDRLREQVEELKTPEGVEAYARSQLGLVKAGETAVVVVDGKESKPATSAPDIDSDSDLTDPVGPWTAFLDLIFGVR